MQWAILYIQAISRLSSMVHSSTTLSAAMGSSGSIDCIVDMESNHDANEFAKSQAE